MFRFVLFDLDGTLLDTLQDLAAACNHALSALGLPVHPAPAYKKMVGSGVPKLIWRMLPEQNRGEHTLQLAHELFGRYYRKHMQDLTYPYPGIREMLKRISAAGVRAAVVSNKTHAFVAPIVEEYFPGRFSVAIGPQEGMVPPKPDPAMVYEALAALHADKADTLYVGDSDVDMLTAKNAGLASCGVLWGFRGEAELRSAGAAHLADTPAALADLILEQTNLT